MWMRIAVIAAGAHGLYDAAFSAGSIESKSLWTALSLGLLAAGADPLRYWPAVLAGLVARVAPQVAFAFTGASHPLSLTFADAIWWAPLSFILFTAYSDHLDRRRQCTSDVLDLALHARTDKGVTIGNLSCAAPVLLVFLRQSGCTFCREALADIAARRRDIEASGTRIVLAHMGQPECGRDLFRKYGLDDLHQISDPCRGLYRAFGLRRGDLWKLFGPKVLLRGLDAGILNGHGLGRLAGDGFQMPGIFLIFHGQVLRSYRHQSAADRPDYVRFITEDAFSRMVS
jgi:peroxiredoxin